jgi:F-type H+-transporting ATPase subunit b
MSLVAARAIRITAAKAPAPSKRAATRATAVKARVADVVDRVKLPAMTLAAQIACAVPAAHAEAGKLFDFDLTLPIIATEFLLLMTILDKTVFGPVGKALDDRDELIRSQLAAVGGNSAEVEALIVRLSDATRARARNAREEFFFVRDAPGGGAARIAGARGANRRRRDGSFGVYPNGRARGANGTTTRERE